MYLSICAYKYILCVYIHTEQWVGEANDWKQDKENCLLRYDMHYMILIAAHSNFHIHALDTQFKKSKGGTSMG